MGYLTDCYTRPEWRGRGVGARLLERVTEWARNKDLEMVLVSPGERSRPFYARAGFAAASDFMTLTLRDWNDPPPAAAASQGTRQVKTTQPGSSRTAR